MSLPERLQHRVVQEAAPSGQTWLDESEQVYRTDLQAKALSTPVLPAQKHRSDFEPTTCSELPG